MADNQALTLSSATGWLVVPRLAFKVVPDRPPYRLLLGNEGAAAPSYDIEGLRRTVLDYAAVPVQPGPLENNPGYRPAPLSESPHPDARRSPFPAL